MNAPAADPYLEAIRTLPREELLEILGEMTAEEQLDILRERFRDDLLWMGAHVWGERFYLPYNVAHEWIAANLGGLPSWQERVAEGQKETCVAVEAPRGLAKTMFLKLIILRAIAYGTEPYIMWLGGSSDEAVKETRHIRAFLEQPSDEFVELYGQPRCMGTDKDWFVHMPSQDRPIKVSTRGIPRGRVRGSNYNGQRPTLVVGDDIEHPDSVRNPRLRDGLTTYINSDVRNAGPKEGGLVWCQFGTRLGQDSQTARAAKDPAYQAMRFQAVIQWPHNAGLWEECRELWADLTDPDRKDTACRFYERRRAEMDDGAVVLDEVAQPIYMLYTLLWSKGWYSFLADYQNDPSDPTRQVFYPSRWRGCTFDGVTITTSKGRRVHLSDCTQALWLDPRASEQVNRNDWAAIARVAKDRHGYIYVLSVDLRRDNTAGQLARVWGHFEMIGPRALYGYEDNGFQTLMGKEFDRIKAERRAAGKAWTCELQGHCSTENKVDRISSLAPRIDNGHIEFCTDIPQPVREQFRQIPTGTHDDGPDAVERAIWLVDGGGTAQGTSRGSLSG